MPLPIAFLGHQDHGKSTLLAQLLLLTGSIKSQQVDAVRRLTQAPDGAWEPAHLLDTFREERDAMMTMDTTRMVVHAPPDVYELIDVPGHGERLAQMVSGASAAEAGCLVVSVAEGIQPQTRQHLDVARLLGIERLIVAVNKMDLVQFREAPFRGLAQAVGMLAQQAGVSVARCVPVAALTGENVRQPSPKTPWHDGPSLLEAFGALASSRRALTQGALRILVQDRYTQGDQAIVVGQVLQGSVAAGADVVFFPGAVSARITELRGADGPRQAAATGQGVGMRLEPDSGAVVRGLVGAQAAAAPQVKDRLAMEWVWFVPPRTRRLQFECGTASREGELEQLPAAGPFPAVASGAVRLQAPLACDPDQPGVLGKLVAKDKGRIIGVGRIRSRP